MAGFVWTPPPGFPSAPEAARFPAPRSAVAPRCNPQSAVRCSRGFDEATGPSRPTPLRLRSTATWPPPPDGAARAHDPDGFERLRVLQSLARLLVDTGNLRRVPVAAPPERPADCYSALRRGRAEHPGKGTLRSC